MRNLEFLGIFFFFSQGILILTEGIKKKYEISYERYTVFFFFRYSCGNAKHLKLK